MSLVKNLKLTLFQGKEEFEEACACGDVRAHDDQDMFLTKDTSAGDSTKVCLNFHFVHLDYYFRHSTKEVGKDPKEKE